MRSAGGALYSPGHLSQSPNSKQNKMSFIGTLSVAVVFFVSGSVTKIEKTTVQTLELTASG